MSACRSDNIFALARPFFRTCCSGNTCVKGDGVTGKPTGLCRNFLCDDGIDVCGAGGWDKYSETCDCDSCDEGPAECDCNDLDESPANGDREIRDGEDVGDSG